ncbi:DNA/RNA non-specific endonuclease [Sediminispirochaeta smaragdinae]|uniref:DNA/RNA non-specific endonuclease n=1 Tax=Sediminispirochaeta smaragdinae TaxID=55206 RepID=UPI0002E0DF35|nr:DNA/RNA non-specific endonuclease [Sediminispirochaeta smaragdinae]
MYLINRQIEDFLFTKFGICARYYTLSLDYVEPDLKAIGFILPNESSSEPLSAFVVSVDQVEAATGLDFFPLLEDGIEEQLESDAIFSRW